MLRAQFKRLAPADGFEMPLAFAANALHRRSQTMRMVNSLCIPTNFGTQRALGWRMVRVADHFDRPTSLDGYTHRAGVGAVVWANCASEFSRSVHGVTIQGTGSVA